MISKSVTKSARIRNVANKKMRQNGHWLNNPWFRDWILIGGVAVIAYFFRRDTRITLLCVGAALVLHSGVAAWVGNLIAGPFFGRRKIERSESPKIFWAFVGFYCLLGLGMIIAGIRGG